jgi:hypothetical protein
MDSSEKLVKIHLESLGYTDIRYEPDGNATSDFLVNGNIAVEVRRLNKIYDDGSGTKGLEEAAIIFER